MLREMTIREFAEWRDYHDLEPFDEVRADLRAAQVVQVLLNIHRRKGRPPIALTDCVLRFGVQPAAAAPTTPEQARAQVMATMDLLMKIYNKPPQKKPGKKRER